MFDNMRSCLEVGKRHAKSLFGHGFFYSSGLFYCQKRAEGVIDVDYRKDNWEFEQDCFRKAVNGSIDGYVIEIAEHYTVERLENEEYADRTFNFVDIAVAIYNGMIIEGYSSEENRKRESNSASTKLPSPSRLVLGKAVNGKLFIVVVGLLASRHFKVLTCYSAGQRHLETAKALGFIS